MCIRDRSRAEGIVASNENVDSYMLRYNNSSGTITAYLKDDRTMDTEDVATLWEKEMSDIDNCTITVEASTSMSFLGRGRAVSYTHLDVYKRQQLYKRRSAFWL